MSSALRVLVITAMTIGAKSVFSQGWSEWINVFEEGPNIAQVSFKVNGCSEGSTPDIKNSYYRTNCNFSREKAWVYFKFDYEVCSSGEIKTESVKIDLSKKGVIGGDWGFHFMGARKIVREPYDIQYKYFGSSGNQTQNNSSSDTGFGSMPGGSSSGSSTSQNSSGAGSQNEVMAGQKEESWEREQEENKKRIAEKENLEEQEKAARTREALAQQDAHSQRVDFLNEQQRRREEAMAASTAAQAESMTALGALIYDNVGPEYDKPANIYLKGSWRFSFNIGYSFTVLPVYLNRTTDIAQASTAPIHDEETIEETKYTPDLNLGVHFWPYYSRSVGLGLILNGKGGVWPGGALTYSYDYGIKIIAGSAPIKLVGMFQGGDRGFSSSDSNSTSLAGTAAEMTTTGEGATMFSRITLGPRISFRTSSSIGNLELLYFMEDYPNLKNISASGFALNYYAHNRLRIYCEVILDAARIGVVKYPLEEEVKNTGTSFCIGVVRTMDRFGGN